MTAEHHRFLSDFATAELDRFRLAFTIDRSGRNRRSAAIDRRDPPHARMVGRDRSRPTAAVVGAGNRDPVLHRVNPLLLLDFLRSPRVHRLPVMLLHCYPYEREVGYLAEAFGSVYVGVRLATYFLGSRGLR